MTVIPKEEREKEMFRGISDERIDPDESGARYGPVNKESEALSRRTQAKSGARKAFMRKLVAKFTQNIADQSRIEEAEWTKWLQAQVSREPGILDCWEEDRPEPTHADPIYD